jgi:hypothetical protein
MAQMSPPPSTSSTVASAAHRDARIWPVVIEQITQQYVRHVTNNAQLGWIVLA